MADKAAMSKLSAKTELEHALDQVERGQLWNALMAVQRAVGHLLRALDPEMR